MTEKKIQRYSISVSARTYDRARAAVPDSLAGFIDDIMTATLDDPVILARVMARCRPRKGADS
jgi:hypothetical protein